MLIAAIFESAGALLAGGDVVSTISKGIIAPDAVTRPEVFVWAMMAALISSALWVNLATWLGAPVSTTHSVVGGVVGAGIAAAGLSAVNWPGDGRDRGQLGDLAAARRGDRRRCFWRSSSHGIIYRDDKIAAARRLGPGAGRR